VKITADGATLRLSGDFDVRSTFTVRTAIYDHLAAQGEGNVIIDLTDVRLVDLTALKVLGVATREAGRSGQHLTLRGCGPAVRRLLHLSHLIRFVELEREAATA
jgi:anti-anti-sigma factor